MLGTEMSQKLLGALRYSRTAACGRKDTLVHGAWIGWPGAMVAEVKCIPAFSLTVDGASRVMTLVFDMPYLAFNSA